MTVFVTDSEKITTSFLYVADIYDMIWINNFSI